MEELQESLGVQHVGRESQVVGAWFHFLHWGSVLVTFHATMINKLWEIRFILVQGLRRLQYIIVRKAWQSSSSLLEQRLGELGPGAIGASEAHKQFKGRTKEQTDR